MSQQDMPQNIAASSPQNQNQKKLDSKTPKQPHPAQYPSQSRYYAPQFSQVATNNLPQQADQKGNLPN